MSVMCMHHKVLCAYGCMFALTLSVLLGLLCWLCTIQLYSRHCSDFLMQSQSIQACNNVTYSVSVYFLFFQNEELCTNVQPITSCMISHLFGHIIRDFCQREQYFNALFMLATGGIVFVSGF